MRIRSASFILATALCAACAVTPTNAGPPLLLAASEKEPDVIWVERETMIPNEVGDPHKVHGLFACYRAPASAPAAPRCFMAQYAWRPEDLNWPGRAVMRDGELLLVSPPVASTPAATAPEQQPATSPPHVP